MLPEMSSKDSPRLFDDSDFDPDKSRDRVSMLEQATPAAVALWRGLLRRKWMIALLTLLGLALGFTATRFMTPMYQAAATVLVEFGKPKVVSVEEVYAGYGKDREHYQTQVQFMQSREVGLRVIRELDLIQEPEFSPIAVAASERADRVADRAAGLAVPDPADRDAAVRGDPAEEAVLARYLAGLEIEPIRQSQLVLVKYLSRDPVLAARIANKVGEAFILAEMDMRLQMTVSANSWLAGRVVELKQRLDQSELKLAEFRESANLVDRRGGPGMATQQVDELSQRLVEAGVRRTQAEQAFNLVRPGAPGREDASPISNDAGVRRAREVLAEAEARFSTARSRYGPSHPAYETAQAEVRQAQDSARRQVDSVYTSISKDFQAATATEQSIRKALDAAKRQTQRDNRYESQASALEQEAEANRTLYQTFLQRLKETSTAADAQRPVARVVDYAVAPTRPISPRIMLITVAAGLAGFLGAVGLAFLLNQMDRSIRSIEELETALGEPLLAALPLLPRSLQSKRGRLVMDEPDEFFSEAVRMAAASLHFSSLDRQVRSIAITSAVASEGKSTFAVNLALALAKNSRVLLIDADLFRSNVHRLLGTRNPKNGLARVLMGDVEAKDAVLRYPGTQLWVMPSGPVQGRAYGVLTPTHFRRLVKALEAHFDLVIVDAPPVEVLSDATAIAGSCSATLLVTRAGQTPLPLLQKAMRRLRRINARMLGVVLSGHDFDKARRHYGETSGFESYREYAAYAAGGDADSSSDGLTEPIKGGEPAAPARRNVSPEAKSAVAPTRMGPLPVPAKVGASRTTSSGEVGSGGGGNGGNGGNSGSAAVGAVTGR